MRRPNIVVLLTDDHGQWAAGCYGNREIRTPGLDHLAANGVRMQNAMTPTPVCSPARATFWTGLYPSQHGIHDYLGPGSYRDGPWIESEVQLGELLCNAGYRCGFFGKWHCGTPEETRPGFEEWFCIGRRTGPHAGEQSYVHNGRRFTERGYQARITTDAALRFMRRAAAGHEPTRPARQAPASAGEGQEAQAAERQGRHAQAAARQDVPAAERQGRHAQAAERQDEQAASRQDERAAARQDEQAAARQDEQAAARQDEQASAGEGQEAQAAERQGRHAQAAARQDAPFFAFVGLVATHSPYADHPPRLVESYRTAQLGDIPREAVHPFGRLTGEGRNAAKDWRERQIQYYAAVSEIDEQLGRIVDTLDEMGELSNTLIVYTADHGLNVGHHGLFGKGNATRPLNMLEESIRVPLTFGGWDGLFGHQVRSEMTDHADLFLTLAEVAGAKPPRSDYPGRSFLPLLTRAASIPGWKRVQIGEYGDLRMARSHRCKLLRRNGRGADQLFDLETDPRETRNVIGDPRYQADVAALDHALANAFTAMADSPKNGLNVASLRSHNDVEAWRGEPD